jgi:EAL domain-containing protein (putative c-di-GMP-specific phosphodiesterase class I)
VASAFSLGDFGTGLSSISRLAQLPFNQIKLDAGFIARSFDFKESRIIQSVVDLGRSLSLEVVAEGVETEKQSLHLEQLGVDCAWGYLFYKSMNGNALAKVLLGSACPSVVVSR